jgi:hypothetical protein
VSIKPFCDKCGAKVEWHVTKAGANMPIDPGPSPGGRFYFGPGLRLFPAAPGSKTKMYACHWDTCPKKGEQAPRRAGFICDRPGCDLDGRHFHCYRCGETDHFANECESGGV